MVAAAPESPITLPRAPPMAGAAIPPVAASAAPPRTAPPATSPTRFKDLVGVVPAGLRVDLIPLVLTS